MFFKSIRRHLIFSGGLGNQMFQYAFLLALREKGFRAIADISLYKFTKMHNGYELNQVFGIDEQAVSKSGLHLLLLRTLLKLKPSCFLTCDNLIYTPTAIKRPHKYIYGYWQNEHYFKDITPMVKGSFIFRNIDDLNADIAQSMAKQESVSLHIRRGDYATFGMTLMDIEYYKRAINIMKKCLRHPRFYIFSDDSDEAKRIAKEMDITYVLVAHNLKDNSYKDMYLMSHCKHNIIANSSFSWWGAWLNNNPNKIVVAPEVWSTKSPQLKPQSEGWILL